MKTTAIVLLAGDSKRFGNGSKQLYKLNHKPLFFYSLNAFEQSGLVDDIILVCSSSNIDLVTKLVHKFGFKKVSKIVLGGSTRSESTKNGLFEIENPTKDDVVLIHDSARPLVSEEVIQRLIEALKISDGVIPVIDNYDSLVNINDKINYVNRDSIKRVQTPQGFNVAKLLDVFNNHWDKNATDEGSLFGNHYSLTYVKGDEKLLKVTTRNDIKHIKELLKQ